MMTRENLARVIHPSWMLSVALLAALNLSPLPVFAQQNDSFPSQAQSSPPNPPAPPPAPLVADSPRKPVPPPATCGPAHFGRCLKDIAGDQSGIWTSPLRIRSGDLVWLLPIAAATGTAIRYDASAHSALGMDRTRVRVSDRISLMGSPLATFGEGAALYFSGRIGGNDHLAETGRLGAEAVVDASIVAEALKLATNRARPYQLDGEGEFWPHGTGRFYINGSFPSGHAISSWALARVVAAEYPHWYTRLGVYTFATAVSVARVTGNKHFPSDVLVGDAFGYLIGGYVVRHHAQRLESSSLFILPLIDPSTRTLGLRVELSPENLNPARFAAFFNRSSRSR